MTAASRPSIVLLGMLTKIPVGGVIWLVAQYALGFQRLGYDVYYVEAHGRVPSMLMGSEHDDPVDRAAAYLRETLTPFGLGDRWAVHDPHTGRCAGMEHSVLQRLYREAALVINLHGGTLPLEEHAAGGRLVYMGTDPVELELELHRGEQHAIDFLEPHVAFFTWGLNYGNPDCVLPWSAQFRFVPSPPPVVMDLWDHALPAGRAFTTVGNWRQQWRQVEFDGRVYTWSKHHEFMKVLDLPARTGHSFELALSSYEEADRALLEEHGWNVRPGFELSRDADTYREYIQRSRGEFSVAKDQNVRLRSGWFSERSATYLAAGHPVIMQDTGFPNALPTGEGLFAFADADGACAAVDQVAGDYARCSRAARELAREYLATDVVLGALLDHVGLSPQSPVRIRQRAASAPVLNHPPPLTMELTPVSRRPLTLRAQTANDLLTRPVPSVARSAEVAGISVVVVTRNNLVVTRLALESLLLGHVGLPYEVVVVDNASSDGTREFLQVLSARNPHVRLVENSTNSGFAAARNQGVALTTGDVVVLLKSDTAVPPGTLGRLAEHLDDPEIGLLGPVTNRCGNEAEVPTGYTTYGEMLTEARERSARRDSPRDIPLAVMFCVAVRTGTLRRVGPLDERFGLGMFEDDDYALRVRQQGLRVTCADDVFVHHFGEPGLGALAPDGRSGALFQESRRLFERKWGRTWRPPARTSDGDYILRALLDESDG